MLKLLLIIVILSLPLQLKADLLEDLVKLTPNEILELKIHKVLVKHKVKKPRYYAKLIAHSKHSVKEKKLAMAILIPESRGDEKVTSSVGAKGAWQVMPAWKKKLKIKGSLYDPAVCLDAAMKVWNIHLIEAKGNTNNALRAYSGGSKNYVTKVQRYYNEITM